MQLVLASTSPFRKQLLERLGLPFTTAAPHADETPLADESPQQLVLRLSGLKAELVAADNPAALVIGSDQTAVVDGTILNKPGSYDNAARQLRLCSGKTVTFLTGLCLLNARSGNRQTDVVPFQVQFRSLTDVQIDHYLRRDQPYNCAGSFKSEGLGIALFERMIGDDPTALIGLPLIRLTRMLEAEGLSPL
jgi:septum formation protein